MKVRAIANGFDGRQRRRVGDVFEFDGPLGKWMEPVDPDTPLPARVAKPPEPKPEPVAGTSAAVKAAEGRRRKPPEPKPEPELAAPSKATGDQDVI